MHQYDYKTAEQHCKHILSLSPDSSTAHVMYGTMLTQTNQFERAIAQFRQAIACDEDDAEAHFSLALALLTIGEFEQGWAEFAWHWQKQTSDTVVRDYTKPIWDGEPIANKTLLIYTEQGVGDSLQFLRFVPEIKARVGQLIIECEPVLIDLIKRSKLADNIISKEDKTLPDYDLRLPLMGLGKQLHLTAKDVMRPVPYLVADPNKIAQWQTYFAKCQFKKHIGLVWAGNPQHSNDHNRSMPYRYLTPLLQQDAYGFYSLLKLLRVREQYKMPDNTSITDLNRYLNSFDDTAAIISTLDLVITVDTATAHLAGALGKPVWILLPFSPDWRWQLTRSDSPWYPTARLFRQPAPGDWASVIAEVITALLKE